MTRLRPDSAAMASHPGHTAWATPECRVQLLGIHEASASRVAGHNVSYKSKQATLERECGSLAMQERPEQNIWNAKGEGKDVPWAAANHRSWSTDIINLVCVLWMSRTVRELNFETVSLYL